MFVCFPFGGKDFKKNRIFNELLLYDHCRDQNLISVDLLSRDVYFPFCMPWRCRVANRKYYRSDMHVFFLFADISVSLLSLVVTACGLALFGVSLFVSWKLCWIPWRERGLPFGNKDNKQESLNYTDTETNDHEYSDDFLGQPTTYPESSMKISHTSPDIPLDAQTGTKENCVHNARMHRQTTEPTSSARSVTPIYLWCQSVRYITNSTA